MKKQESIKSRRAKEKKRQRLILTIVIGVGAVLLAAGLIVPRLLKTPVVSRSHPMVNGNSMGDPNAPVKVEEFSDFQCPYCGYFATTLEPDFETKYVSTGKVYFTYIPFSFVGPESVAAAEAAYCASDQDKFWEYHDLVFANQNGENQGTFSTSKLKSFASDLKLDMTAFNQCFDSEKYKDKIKENLDYGTSKGVTGTPYFLVDDKLVDYGQLDAAIQEALTAKGQ